MKTIFKHITVLFIIWCMFQMEGTAQITSGKIVFERKTNLLKKFKSDGMRDWIKDKEKIKIDEFQLLFNDSLTAFKPIEKEERERMSWATSQNEVYQNLHTKQRLTIKEIWGEKLWVSDSLRLRLWKITDSKRVICGYTCRKTIWLTPDTQRIYAWYCNEIPLSIGPESFTGLPGAILGLATEDGGVIYFAKNVELVNQEVSTLVPPKSKNKIYTSTELRKKLETDFGQQKWGKDMIKETFGIW